MRTTDNRARRRVILLALVLGCAAWGWHLSAAQPSRFDKLSDDDRTAFSKRFEKDIWPLMNRNGKDGCVGCHSSGQVVSSLRIKQKEPDKVFLLLLKGGYFLPDDVGSMLHMVSSKDTKERMPKNQPPWTAAEIQTLSQFVQDLDKKHQKKPD